MKYTLIMLTAFAASVGLGVVAGSLMFGSAASAQAQGAAFEPLPPELRSGIIRPVTLDDAVQKQYAIQDHHGEWIKLYRMGTPPTAVWMNLSTHQAWEVAQAEAAPAAAPAGPQVLPPLTP